jgi:hypothetical protein
LAVAARKQRKRSHANNQIASFHVIALFGRPWRTART